MTITGNGPKMSHRHPDNVDATLPVRFEFKSQRVRWEFVREAPDSTLDAHFGLSGEPAFLSYWPVRRDDEMLRIDPEELQRKFLRLEYGDPDAKFLAFLDSVGRFGGGSLLGEDQKPTAAEINGERRFYFDGFPLKKLFLYQSALRKAISNKSKFYGKPSFNAAELYTPNPRHSFEFQIGLSSDGMPLLLASTHNYWQAAMLYVHKMHIEGAEVKKCARPDCDVQYFAVGGYDRKYCDPYCGHLMYMRKKRKEQRWQKQEMESIVGKIARATGSRGKTAKAEGEGARREPEHSPKRRTRAARS
jgi:hypothetical protein